MESDLANFANEDDATEVRTRFAPSPTGRLHRGHALSASLNKRYAEMHGGTYLLRIEDIDPSRRRPDVIQDILGDLAWLGLAGEEKVLFQSHRMTAYAEAITKLKARGLLYPCFCTRSELAVAGMKDGVYPGTCRHLSTDERAKRKAEQRPFAVRLDMAAATALLGKLTWRDLERGTRQADPGRFGDIVVVRKETPTSYHLACVVDDAHQRINPVIRGEEFFGQTDIQVLLATLLDLPVPRYWHHPMVLEEDGSPLSKSKGSASLADARADGVGPNLLLGPFFEMSLPPLS
ncbi:MAG: tRNA glutamyl-Q(34) synthetase GluQRS [Pseudomonadota bacterium]